MYWLRNFAELKVCSATKGVIGKCPVVCDEMACPKNFRVEKLPARVKREIGLFAANSIFVSSHNCYSANAHPIGKKINLL